MKFKPRMETDQNGKGERGKGRKGDSPPPPFPPAPRRSVLHVHPWSNFFLIALLALAGCQSLPPEQAIDLTEPGWVVRQGQAVWWRGAGTELSGELIVASHPDGRAWVQFLKTPVVLVTARTSSNRWRIEAAPDYLHEGYGAPPSAAVWLHLAKFIHGAPPPGRWGHERRADGSWWLHNRTTGERLEGFLNP